MFTSIAGTGSTVCLIAPGQDAYSETFIRAHIEHLPAKVLPVYGSIAQLRDEHGHPLVPPFTIWRHAKWSIARRTTHASWDDFQAAPFKEYLRANRVSAVLAEYGTMGVAVMDVCAEVGVPLIVHFHGFDAHRHDVLAEAGQRYSEMFGLVRRRTRCTTTPVGWMCRALGAQRRPMRRPPSSP